MTMGLLNKNNISVGFIFLFNVSDSLLLYNWLKVNKKVIGLIVPRPKYKIAWLALKILIKYQTKQYSYSYNKIHLAMHENYK